jgi:signal transduction histidine kinase
VAREDLDESDPGLVESLDDIVAETDRLETRVRTVLDLARPFESSPLRGDLNAFVRGFAEGFRSRLPPNVELALTLDPAVPETAFDAAHLTEALDVLLTNAVQAVNGGGRLEIATHLESDGARSRVGIDVRDDGAGMSAGQLARAFELFYTTKAGGTGIGLSVAKRFVEGQGGTIDVASEPGKGTTFTIRLTAS